MDNVFKLEGKDSSIQIVRYSNFPQIMIQISLGNTLKILRRKNKFPEIILETLYQLFGGKHFDPAYGFNLGGIYLFKVNDGNAGTDFTLFSGVSFVDFEQVIACWEGLIIQLSISLDIRVHLL